MIQVYADGVLAYDSRMEKYDLVGLTVTTGLNIGGTATIIMPRDHPAYDFFVSHKTIVTIYRDGILRFRGRALYPADSFYGERTITCEGEMCLLRDSVSRPYSYTASPADIFSEIITMHNGQIEPYKQFVVGQVSVAGASSSIAFESENAETTLDTLNKLLEQCGGYITFTDSGDGFRVIHWLQSVGRRSGQVIEFGENLLDFTSTGAGNTEIATGLVPYGAKDKETEKRLTIESVNDGKDYILAEDAIAARGTIFTTETWDDITDPGELLEKAQAHLAQKKLFITSLTLTALDLSYLNKSLDCFLDGDMIRVVSAPHGVDEEFQLTKMKEDLLTLTKGSITMGKDIQTLTGFGVREKQKQDSNLEIITAALKKQYTADLEQTATAVENKVLEKSSGLYASQELVNTLQQETITADQALSDRITALEEKMKLLEG